MKNLTASESRDVSTKTAQEIETMTGVPIERLRHAVKAGFVPSPQSGKYPLAGTLVGLNKFQNRLLSEAGGMPVYDSMAQCAACTGMPLSNLKQAKRSGCQAFKWNRVSLAPLLKWMFSKDGENQDWNSRLKKAQALREEMRLEKDRNEVIDFATLRYFLREMIAGHLFGELERMQGQLPAVLKGMTEIQIFEHFGKEIEGLKAGLRARLEKMMGGAPVNNGNGTPQGVGCQPEKHDYCGCETAISQQIQK